MHNFGNSLKCPHNFKDSVGVWSDIKPCHLYVPNGLLTCTAVFNSDEIMQVCKYHKFEVLRDCTLALVAVATNMCYCEPDGWQFFSRLHSVQYCKFIELYLIVFGSGPKCELGAKLLYSRQGMK